MKIDGQLDPYPEWPEWKTWPPNQKCAIPDFPDIGKSQLFALPEGTTLGAVVRGEDVIIAHHDTTVQPDDHLILFLTDRRHIEAVEKLFQGSASFL